VTPGAAGQRIGRYTLHGDIASGGMATVHFGRLAGAGGFSRIVAIKLMHLHLADDPEFRAMFLEEARLAARIRHPNVVSTIDVGTTKDGMFLVMEYVLGESLAALLRAAARAGERVPVGIALRVMVDVVTGLHAAHVATDDAGRPLSIVHRDVSPQNIIVGPDGHARVLDFGIAKAAGRSVTTREGHLKGKLRYMAPEQVMDQPVSARTDVYSASVVTWELLTGKPLFTASNDAAVMARVLEGVVPPPSKLRPGLAPEIDALLLKGMARDPADRFSSAEEMAEALEGCQESTTSRQVGAWVTHMLGPELEGKRERIRRIEQSPSVPALVVSSPTEAYVAPFVPELAATTERLASPLPPEPPPPDTWRERSMPAGPFVAPAPMIAPPRTPVLVASAFAVALGTAIAGVTWASHQQRAVDGASVTDSGVSAATSAPSVGTARGAAATAMATASATADAGSTSAATSTGGLIPAATAASAAVPSVAALAADAGGAGGASHTRPVHDACIPPYIVDASGIRRVKPQCIR
jgi:serine/threonine protein kinase